MIKVYAEGTCRQRILETAANQDELIAQAGLLAMADTLCRAGWVLRLEGNSHDGWTAQFGSIRNPLYCGATLSKALASAVRWAWAQGYGEAA